MAHKKAEVTPTHGDCLKSIGSIKDALDAVNGKWKLPIIVALSSGPKRFKDLQRTVSGITAKILSKELKDLELNEFVKRTVYDSMPVAVEYNITAYSKTLEPLLNALREWGEMHKKHIMGSCRDHKAKKAA